MQARWALKGNQNTKIMLRWGWQLGLSARHQRVSGLRAQAEKRVEREKDVKKAEGLAGGAPSASRTRAPHASHATLSSLSSLRAFPSTVYCARRFSRPDTRVELTRGQCN